MTVLNAFNGGREQLTLSELAERCDIGRSAIQRIVYTLAYLGYLDRAQDDQSYRLTARMFQLCDALVGQQNAGPRIAAALKRLAEETGESVAWVGRDGDEIVILQSVRSQHYSHVSLPVGQRFNVLTAASGQVFLAHLDRQEAETIFLRADDAARRRMGTSDFETYADVLQDIRDQGYALTEKSEDLYSVSMSVPVFSTSGPPLGMINVSALQSRLPKSDAVARLLAPMREAAEAVTRAIGF